MEGEAGDPTELLEQLPEARLTRRLARDPANAIGKESALGYDLVVLGATESREGTFNTVIDRVLSRVGVPTVVVRFPESYPVSDDLPRRILVPMWRTAGVPSGRFSGPTGLRRASVVMVVLR